MNFPILSVIVFTPVVAGVILLFFPQDRHDWIRWFALAAATLALLLSLVVFIGYDSAEGGYQFQERAEWIPALGISYFVGVDGMSAPMVLLTGIVIFTGVLISWRLDDRPREFFLFLFILATGVFGVFVSLDLFQLFFFYEIALFPMFLLIAIWGWKVTREYAAMKLTLYLFIGSVIALVGGLVMVFSSGLETFDMLQLQTAGFSTTFQRIWFPFVFFGFAVLAGIFPFHNWSPDGHVAAPTAVSMFHAGVLMKLGAFAALRVGIVLLPEGARFWAPLILVLASINVIYGAFIAMVQTDFKYVIGFSSVSHMGLVLLGFATLNRDGLTGAGLQMFSHGVMTALFFAVVGMVYDRTHTREIPRLGGISKVMPLATVAFIVGGLVSMGMPGLSGFVAEFPIFMGLWRTQPIIAIVVVISIVITAAYIMRIIGKVFFGAMPEEFEGQFGDVLVQDKVALVLLSALLVLIGVYPAVMAPMVASGAEAVLRALGVG
ncbi:MAG: NADH-quinone oxidoreductase subunit M [Chloroflexi bacterium]|nr:NADH-quinone oxidoreductase subunit M [Chloroflexota bacterium]MCH8341900.1 NADH-quinone oxidoreductase subunit M [Chloroflexota bacterium]MCI0773767.1 NADH-quinone oxidoreductase subunit M [Chloroflexota bacterium]MCI0806617.1 NADH-quinone oxidoreductase subunit M [Chloroflexota bacterium]MCI0827687.1 NADH-quinone oxidoreductase subunit M [Chloroflexota bacterium]